MAEILRREIALNCSPAHAFRVFTEQVDLWWPRSHRRDRGATLIFEPGEAGRLVERGATGEWTMARITGFDPPARLSLDWFPGSPQAPTHVEVAFNGSETGTTVTIVHQPLTAGAAEIWPRRVAQFVVGWDTVLPALRAFIDANAGETEP